jgi:hypothetical protein
VRRRPPSTGAGAKLDAWVDPERGLSPASPLPVSCGSARLLHCSSTSERPCLPLRSCRRRGPSVATSTGGLLPLSRATTQIWQQRPELGLSPQHGGHGRCSLAPGSILGNIFPVDAPKLQRRTGSTFAVDQAYNSARLGDKAWEHEPPSSFRETTAASSLASGREVSVRRSARRRLAAARCTCPK